MHMQTPTRALILTVFFIAALGITPLIVNAQNDAPQVAQTAEYNIGFNCPVSATLAPDQTILWVLMDNCGNRKFTLQGFQVTDGSPIKAADDNFAGALAPLTDQWIYVDTRPLAFTPDGAVDVRYNNADTYDALNLRLSLTGDQPPTTDLKLLTRDAVQVLIPGYDGYLETTTFNAHHTLAVVPNEGTSALHIFDLRTSAELFQIEFPSANAVSAASFSPDDQHLYITTLKNPDDVSDNNSTLNIYDLKNGKLIKSYNVPSYLNSVSPDEHYIVGLVGGQFDAALLITELETGKSSPPILVNEQPHQVTECLNSGKKVSDVGFKTRGELPVRDVVWMPDSSGFLTVNSYLGDGAYGGSICNFNYSRLRAYSVQ